MERWIENWRAIASHISGYAEGFLRVKESLADTEALEKAFLEENWMKVAEVIRQATYRTGGDSYPRHVHIRYRPYVTAVMKPWELRESFELCFEDKNLVEDILMETRPATYRRQKISTWQELWSDLMTHYWGRDNQENWGCSGMKLNEEVALSYMIEYIDGEGGLDNLTDADVLYAVTWPWWSYGRNLARHSYQHPSKYRLPAGVRSMMERIVQLSHVDRLRFQYSRTVGGWLDEALGGLVDEVLGA